MPRITGGARRALIEERQAQILSAAAQVFAKKGFERATIADIAKAAGVAEGSIYNYFKNKEDLLISLPRQIVQPAVETIHAEMPALEGGEMTPEQALTMLARTMIATIKQNAHLFRILLSTVPMMKQAMRDKYMQQVILYATDLIGVYFAEQKERGIFRADLDPVIATRAFIGMFFPNVLLREVLQIRDPSHLDYDQVIAQAVQLFLRGALASNTIPSPPAVATPRASGGNRKSNSR